MSGSVEPGIVPPALASSPPVEVEPGIAPPALASVYAPEELTVLAGGRAISGWTEIRVTRGVERFPSDFECALTERYPNTDDIALAPGDSVQVKLGNDLVLTGWVDRYMVDLTPDRHEVRVSGRSLCEDLVDCSADLGGQSTIAGVTVTQLAQQLCTPYGISVNNVAGTDGPPSPAFSVNLGETAYDVLERLARWAQVLLYDDPSGNLVISQVGTQSMSSGFSQGVNVQAASVALSADQRFHDYKVVWQSIDSLSDTAPNSNVSGTATDEQVRPKRLLYIVSEQYLPGVNLGQARAEWERNRRWGRSQALRVVTDSWRDSAGKLWEPNWLVQLDIPTCKVSGASWVISEVTYSRTLEAGTTAELLLMPPQAFAAMPELPPNSWRDVLPDGAPT